MGALGRRGRAASSGGAGAGRGKGGAAAARRDGGRPAAPRRALVRRGSPGSFRFSRGGCPALWGKRQRNGDGGGWSRLWPGLAPAPRLPAPPAPARPLCPAPPGRGAAPAAKATTSSPGRRARAGRPAGARSRPGGGGGVAAPSGDRRWELRGAVPRRANVGGGWNQVSRIAASARAWYMPTKLRKCLVELLAWIIHYDSVTLLRSPLLLFCSHPLHP